MRWGLVIGGILLASATVVAAQSANDLFNQAVNAGTSYRSAYSAYVAAKNQHQQYHTAATRLVALAKTNEVLVGRNAWLISYLKFLRAANSPQTGVYLDLENQINTLSTISDLGSGNSFAQINAAASAWEKRLEAMDKLVAAAQLQISSTSLANFQSQLVGFVGEYRRDHASPTASQATTLNLLEAKLSASIRTREEVDSQLATYTTGYWAKSTLLKQLNQGRGLLLEAARLLWELSGGS